MRRDIARRRGNIRQVIFAARYGAHLGNYMMHCHNIVHEDHDMLRAFLVRPPCAVPVHPMHLTTCTHGPAQPCAAVVPPFCMYNAGSTTAAIC